MAQQPVSLHAPVGDDGDVSVGDFIEDKSAENPSDVTSYSLLREKLSDVLTTLTERERKILEMRFGLLDGYERTLEEIGKMYNVTRERIRQIEAKALRKLRHPTRVRHLQGFLDTAEVAINEKFKKPPAISRRGRFYFSDLDRQDEHRAAVLVKAALQFKDRVVVQPARDQAFILEHELAGEKLRLRKFFGDAITQLGRLVHDVRAEREVRLGVKAALAHVGDVTVHFRPGVFAQVVHLGRALEIARIQHADLHEDKILINLREHPHDGKQRVQAEAVETVDQQHGGAGVRHRTAAAFFPPRCASSASAAATSSLRRMQFFLRLPVMVFHPERDADRARR